jgi:serine/threonine protein kinase
VDLLVPEVWENIYQNGEFFRDKIVLIGPTSISSQDFHRTPMDEKMPGVEIHANAIASLQEGKSLGKALPYPLWRGGIVFLGIMATGISFLFRRRWWNRLIIALSVGVSWLIVSYLYFLYGSLFIPTAAPVIGIITIGLAYALYGALKEVLSWLELRKTFKHYASSPIVREIIARQDDLQDILEEKETEILSRNLGGRYQISKALSEGGFGKTYIAMDLQRPGKPECVVKKLQPVSDNPQHWELAKRLFVREAQVLEQLGTHDQIPQLLAYFDDGEEFYLVQELIVGEPLSKELSRFLDGSEVRAINILEELLPVLDFIHSKGVIHRDIKPPNVIRRKKDDKLVLIDFGTVKELSEQMIQEFHLTEEQKKFTIAIGTKGYTPPEQAGGSPRYSSDIYALGMIAIQALTLLHPSLIEKDPHTDELLWEENLETHLDPAFIALINKMICRDFTKRYQNAKDILKDIKAYKKSHSPLERNLKLNSLRNKNYHDDYPDLKSSDAPTVMPEEENWDLTNAPTAMPEEEDLDLTNAPTVMPEEEYWDLTNAPTVMPEEEDWDLTNAPTATVHQEEDLQINK